jgi:hypothetical protein
MGLPANGLGLRGTFLPFLAAVREGGEVVGEVEGLDTARASGLRDEGKVATAGGRGDPRFGDTACRTGVEGGSSETEGESVGACECGETDGDGVLAWNFSDGDGGESSLSVVVVGMASPVVLIAGGLRPWGLCDFGEWWWWWW